MKKEIQTKDIEDVISESDIDLTEKELERIFFGSGKPGLVPEPSESIPVKEKSIRPPKLKREDSIPESSEDTNIPKKRPQGRPVIWTEEKIKERKEENKRIAAEKRKKKKELERQGKINTNEPITQYEQKKLIDQAVKSKSEIEKLISEKRTFLKSILGTNVNRVLDTKFLCAEHLFEFRHFEDGFYVTSCKHCSAQQRFSSDEWTSYISKNRKRL